MAQCGGQTPGPAYAFGTLTGYNGHDCSKSRAPAYSLGLKTTTQPPPTTPGPYNVGNVNRNGRYPYMGWTIESKAGVRKKPFGPGPLDYAPKMPYTTPAFSLGLKLPPKDRSFGPSAADYFPQYSGRGPAFTMGTSRKQQTKFVPPGPKAATPLELYKPRAPAFSLGLKGPGQSSKTPSPGPIYLPQRCCRQHVPHAYSFGLKGNKCAPPMITYEDRQE